MRSRESLQLLTVCPACQQKNYFFTESEQTRTGDPLQVVECQSFTHSFFELVSRKDYVYRRFEPLNAEIAAALRVRSAILV